MINHSKIGNYIHYSIRHLIRWNGWMNKVHKNTRQYKKRKNKTLKLLNKVEKIRKSLSEEDLDFIREGLKKEVKKRLANSQK